MDHGCFGSRYGHIAHSFYCSDMIVISLAWRPINHTIECLDINNHGKQGQPRQSSPHNPRPMNSARPGSLPIAQSLTHHSYPKERNYRRSRTFHIAHLLRDGEREPHARKTILSFLSIQCVRPNEQISSGCQREARPLH